jgi:phenylalanine-4-hydroxylase
MAYEEISRIPDHNAIIEKFPKPTGFKIMVINHA